MKDTFTIGAVAGIIATIAMHLASMIFEAIGLAKMSSLEISARLLLNPAEMDTIMSWTVGALVHLMLGAAGGVALAYFIRFSGKDYYWLKGLGLGGLMLIVGMGLILSIMGITELRGEVGTTLAHIIDFSIYGLITSYIIARYVTVPQADS